MTAYETEKKPETTVDALPESVRRMVNRLNELSDAAAKGNWGEFSMHVPANPNRDADLVLADVAVKITRLTARVQELEREKLALTAERDHAALLQRRAEAELAAVRKRIAESATATLRITYEEDRAMGVYLRDMDIGALCWLDGECVRLLPLDDEAKS